MGTLCNSTKKPGQDGDLAQQHKAMTMPLLKPGLSNSDSNTSVSSLILLSMIASIENTIMLSTIMCFMQI